MHGIATSNGRRHSMSTIFMGTSKRLRTDANAERAEVRHPKEHPGSLQLQGEVHNAREDEAGEECEHQFVHHLQPA